MIRIVTKDSEFDIIIIGAGVSGMILADELLSRTNKKVLIIEKRKKFSYDKNLCFWNKPKNLITEVANNEWNKIAVYSNGEKKLYESNEIKYLRINSKTFYSFFIDRFKKRERIILKMNCSLKKIKRLTNQIIIETSRGTFKSNIVFDSSLKKEDLKKVKLFQHFKGIEIKTSKPVFKNKEVILMDIQNKKNIFNFMYLLPFSKDRALVESTYFSSEIYDKEVYMQDIKEYIHEKFRINDFHCKYKEFGIIPMGKIVHNDIKNIIKIGIAGNWNRLSTGYSLQNAFIYSKQLVDQILKNKPPKIKEKYLLNFLDNIFCSFVLTQPRKVKSFFKSFFFKNRLIDIVNFLNSTTSLVNIIRIIISLPKLRLIQTLFTYRKW